MEKKKLDVEELENVTGGSSGTALAYLTRYYKEKGVNDDNALTLANTLMKQLESGNGNTVKRIIGEAQYKALMTLYKS